MKDILRMYRRGGGTARVLSSLERRLRRHRRPAQHDRQRCFEPIRDPENFKNVKVEAYGHNIYWGDQADDIDFGCDHCEIAESSGSACTRLGRIEDRVTDDIREKLKLPALRPHRHRFRSRRLRLRHPRGAARHEGRGGREGRDLRRHLPQRRLHPVEGAAARFRAVRGGRPPVRHHGHQGRQARARSRRHDEIQGRGRRRQRQGRRLPVQEEQDRRLSRRRPHRGARQGRGEEPPTARPRRWKPKAIVIATGSDVARLKGIDDRREARRLLDRCAGARQGAGETPRHRRRA